MKKRKIIGMLIAMSLVLGWAPKWPIQAVQADEIQTNATEVASGSYGTSPWSIDEEGVLHIEAGTFSAGFGIGSSPWNDYKDVITKIVFEGPVVGGNNSSRLFQDLSKSNGY